MWLLLYAIAFEAIFQISHHHTVRRMAQMTNKVRLVIIENRAARHRYMYFGIYAIQKLSGPYKTLN